jgi:hypothetical protein
MKRLTSTLAIAVVASAFGASCAQINDGSKSVPTQQEGQQSQPAAVASGEVRDWAAIDKNNDNLISPEEMEAALKQNAPTAKNAPKR